MHHSHIRPYFLAYRPVGTPCTPCPYLRRQDCPADQGMVVALGHQFPNYTYGANVGVHDLRMYVGPALSDAQVRRPEP